MNLPNKLTTGRMCAIPFFIVAYLLGYNIIATIIFIIAAATDALDGHIARSRGLVTNFGKIMDPLADKMLVISAFVCMVQTGAVPGWMVIVVLAREFAITGLRTVAAAEGIVIAAGTTGKIKTITQMVAVPLLLLENWPFNGIGIPVDQIFLWVSVIMTIVSGIEYVVKNKNVILSQGM
ncbi:MAG: CDP-diacylglycerol--glycerol-3-phosphate 3-phosphatidyltransferase [Anaerovoracaceae bacterium]